MPARDGGLFVMCGQCMGNRLCTEQRLPGVADRIADRREEKQDTMEINTSPANALA
jgi:hypothetical protein